ncbi:exodeoxyribonuclease 7 large subunit [Sporomusaceae bacterium FL31]|nr:exodeoxyribonuclease 7 large subunit [Sporomusaceae bacterium FL31]GCE33295.1 exodeoxyribonuclease 7 large subunit [Sporomusaceae bacterium]
MTEITRYIKDVFDHNRTLKSVYIRGEISNFKRHYSGHCYFTLKDSGATIKAVMFKSKAQFVKFEPVDGLKVVAGGYVTIFERDGQYQLYVEQLLPEGVGELSLAFAQLKEKLAAEGLFDDARKQQLPLLPKRVGVITSPTGAALRDIVSVAKRRHPGVQLCLIPVQVQGQEAPRQIANALNLFNRLYQVDVIIVGRGGGSIEELWSFNDEAVVRSIAQSNIPVVSAVGHQTDYTLADFAADVRAATPSQAAELVVPDARELYRYVVSIKNLLESSVRNHIQNKKSRLEQNIRSRVLTRPQEIIDAKRQSVDSSLQRLIEIAKKAVVAKQHQFNLAAEKLAMLNPLAVLARGYGIIRTQDGHVINKVTEVVHGQNLEVVLRDGSINIEVISVKEEQR